MKIQERTILPTPHVRKITELSVYCRVLRRAAWIVAFVVLAWSPINWIVFNVTKEETIPSWIARHVSIPGVERFTYRMYEELVWYETVSAWLPLLIGLLSIESRRWTMKQKLGRLLLEFLSGRMETLPGTELKFGKHPVSQFLWSAVMGFNPSRFQDEDRPVENVSWNDCRRFLKKLNSFWAMKESGIVFRLPNEAEWEKACRAGLYDRLGNIREWTQTKEGETFICRGGGGDSPLADCNSHSRKTATPDARSNDLGFRLCFTIPMTGANPPDEEPESDTAPETTAAPDVPAEP